MSKIFVKPSSADLKVRHPDIARFFIPSDGMLVDDSSYFIRLIKCGDLVVVNQLEPQVVSMDTTKGAK